jgi:hypothetical protein
MDDISLLTDTSLEDQDDIYVHLPKWLVIQMYELIKHLLKEGADIVDEGNEIDPESVLGDVCDFTSPGRGTPETVWWIRTTVNFLINIRSLLRGELNDYGTEEI